MAAASLLLNGFHTLYSTFVPVSSWQQGRAEGGNQYSDHQRSIHHIMKHSCVKVVLVDTLQKSINMQIFTLMHVTM